MGNILALKQMEKVEEEKEVEANYPFANEKL